MTISENDLMADFIDRTIDAIDLTGGDDPRFTLEVSEDGRAGLIFAEPLRFHADYHGTDWTAWIDEDGNLTDDREDALIDRVKAHLAATIGGDPLEVGTIDTAADEPTFEIEVHADYRDGETFDAWHGRIGWPIIATLINISDPGTWNSPYLFTSFTDA